MTSDFPLVPATIYTSAKSLPPPTESLAAVNPVSVYQFDGQNDI